MSNVGSSNSVDSDGTSDRNATAEWTSLVDILAVTDSDDPSDAVVFQLTGLPQHGMLYLGEKQLSVGETFSQLDIDNGVLTYQSSAGDLEPGTYRAGDTTGLGADNYDMAWSGIDVFGATPPQGANALDVANTVTDRITVSDRGIGLQAANADDALVLDFRTEISGVRLQLIGCEECNVTDGALWEAYDASGGSVDLNVAAAAGLLGNGEHADRVAVAADGGVSFRYLLVRAGECATQESAFYLRHVEFDVIAAPEADAFSFRAEGGRDLDIGDADPALLGYSVVNGEAIYSIALVPALA